MAQALIRSVEGTREFVSSTQDLTAKREGHTVEINTMISRTSDMMSQISITLEEQSNSTGELAQGVVQIADSSKIAAEFADEVVEAVRKSEAIINREFELLDQREINDYVLHRAKSDHYLWKKKLSEMLVGYNSLTENELTDHKSCRLGKWYGSVSDPTVKQHPAYSMLDKPHADVHIHGREAAARFHRGDIDGAQKSIASMEEASVEVIELLNKLLQR